MYGTMITTVVSLSGLLLLTASSPVSVSRATDTVACKTKTNESQPLASLTSRLGRLPLHFEINRGQSAPDVKFISRGRGYGLALRATDAVLTLSGPAPAPAAVRLTFVGARSDVRVEGQDELQGKTNYLIGSDPRAWRTNIPTYARVRYREIYPGIDVMFHGDQQQLEYDLLVAPGRDPRTIALRVDGVDRLAIDPTGDLLLHVGGGTIHMRKPTIYQREQADAPRRPVDGRYVLTGTHQVAFSIGKYDETRPLVIDPVLVYSSYLGGTGSDQGNGIAVDAAGSAYLIGTAGADFPVSNPLGGDADAFIVKLNPQGTGFVYATALGGAAADAGVDIRVDDEGQAYVVGTTSSDNFPTQNPAQPQRGGDVDGFMAKLNAAGDALIYATYLGGGDRELTQGIAIDRAGAAYATGETQSSDFPTVNPIQPDLSGVRDAFVTKLSPDGTSFVYSTYLGGTSSDLPVQETGFAIAVNDNGSAFVVGTTGNADFPTVNAFQSTFGGGSTDAFVARLSRTGSSLLFSTFLGGGGSEDALGVALDGSGRPVVAGSTGSTNFPTRNPLQPANAGFLDAFVTKLRADGSGLAFSTYLGGGESEAASSVALDSAANVYITGTSGSLDFPVVDAIQPDLANVVDAIVTKISANGGELLYSTYLGGFMVDTGHAIAVDLAGSAYVTGLTRSADFPVVNPLQSEPASEFEAFFAKISDFDLCLQDERQGHTLQIDLSTGGYQFSGCGGASGATLIGRGRITRLGAFVLLQDRGVFALFNSRLDAAIATVFVPGAGFFTIADGDTTGNTCTCD
jgi:hypothetical protein